MASWQRTPVLYHDPKNDVNWVLIATAESILQRCGRIQKSQIKLDWCMQAKNLFPAPSPHPMTIMICNDHKYPQVQKPSCGFRSVNDVNHFRTLICTCR